MKTSRFVLLLTALLGLSLLAACGNKGALVRPTETTDTPAKS